MGCGSGSWRFLFRAFLFVCFLVILLVEMLASRGFITITTTTKIATPSTASSKQFEVMIGRDKPAVHPDLDPNYMSKRRVPNGPDPIHNRRAGKSRQPPGRA
ncbi:PREDICTED: CLAVATA3/ESR (CLE)-related protein 25-like [Nelumbo nucifera]|uniref:CLAVATA3/ESR (CLE)-related protein 25-like n=2 Tax=Nelumbo nucifera TaxID=4432 RepID=A0A1U8A389_NELNU|nr:PREDICTED: CLAVATA3/ESR (CLE)-related protein 25-like [Nelumbo nucifera]DAD34743.1 TPA_asm: hypothetical protein HUJ06_005383 [Nelumbo nucifera]